MENLLTQELYEKASLLRDDEYSEVLMELHKRPEDIQLAFSYASTSHPVYQEIGIDVLAQIGYTIQPALKESDNRIVRIKEILKKTILSDIEDVVVASIYAVGHRQFEDFGDEFYKYLNSTNDEIRQALSYSFPSIKHPKTIDALIKLSSDSDFETRNWATFGLGTQLEENTPEICKALFANINDESTEIVGEAVLGLAVRKYEGIESIILNKLKGDSVNINTVEACEVFPKTEFIEHLEYWLKKAGPDEYFDNKIRDAIKACEGVGK